MSEQKKLGLLLTTSPEHANTNTVIKLAEAALEKGVEVRIFLTGDGVFNINHINFLRLTNKGAHVCACMQNLNERFQDEADDIQMGGLYDLAKDAREVDRLLAFC